MFCRQIDPQLSIMCDHTIRLVNRGVRTNEDILAIGGNGVTSVSVFGEMSNCIHRRSVQRFHRYPSSTFNIVARAFKFSGYLQPQNILSGNIFGLILKNKMAARADFLLFFFIFPHPLTLAVLQPQFLNFQDKLGTIRGYLKILLLECVCVCMCAHWFGGLNLLSTLCSKYYSIQIYQIFSISSSVLGVVIAQIWSLCSDWLCLFWSRCLNLHTRFFAKVSLSCLILVLEVCNQQPAYGACF